MAILFVHGAGDNAFRVDFEIVKRLRDSLGRALSLALIAELRDSLQALAEATRSLPDAIAQRLGGKAT